MLYKLCVIILVQSMCILKIPVKCDLVQASGIRDVDCSGCYHIPDAESNSSLKGTSHFSAIFRLDNNTVLIGARDTLLTITLDGELIHAFVMNTTADALKQCVYRHNGNAEKCFNDIDFIIQQDNGVIIACGQNSDEPNCQKVNGTEILSSSFSHPYYTKQEITYINAGTNVFTASHDLSGYGRISKIDLYKMTTLKRTFKTSTSPKFISVYEFENFIYFFFNEFAEEITDTANKIVYSRVARICKYDHGGQDFSGLSEELILYAKARLVCNKPKPRDTMSSTVYYNLLEQTSFVKTENGSVFIYGVFKSDDPDVDLSVICRFSLSEIKNVFMTSTYYKDGKKQKNPIPNDPRLKKCNSSLDTKMFGKDVLKIATDSPLAYTAVKPDGNRPVLELHDARISHILSDHVASSLGPYHVIYLFDSNNMYDVTVPIKLPGVTHVLSRTKIFKDPLQISTVAKIKDVLLVAAKEVLAFIPEAPCQISKSCRDCISARNPFCAWHENSCVKYDSSQNSTYKQDIENGNYTNVCDPEEASCELSMKGMLIPDEGVVLSCELYGIPKAKVKSWMRDGVILDLQSAKINETRSVEDTRLLIKKYTLDVAGNYTCNVDNGLTTGSSCSFVLPGSSPQLVSRVTKNGSWWLTCNATGFPKPTLFLYHSYTTLELDVAQKIEISDSESYRCVAYSVFGMVTGETYKIFSKRYGVKIVMPWNQKYADTRSPDYAGLSRRFNNVVQKLYKNNERFGGIGNVTFSKGSVIASFVLTGLTMSSSGEIEFTAPLQDAITNGKLGEFNVTEYNGEPDPSPDHQSTSKPLTTASTRPSTRSGPPKSSRPFTTTRLSSSAPYTGPAGPPKADAGGSPSSGVPVWLVVFLILLFSLLIFIAAYFCGMRNLLCSWRKSGRSSKNSLSVEDCEMDAMSRKEKGRESKKKLIYKNPAKRPNSPGKNTNSHKDISVEDIHGSVEIKPVNDKSTC